MHGHLQSQPDFDPQIITKALGIAKLSSPELTGHKEKSVRALVAMALSEAASPQVVDPLVRLIQNPDEDAEVVRAAVSGLGRTGDPRAAAPLFSLMQKRPEMRQSVIDALAKSTAAPQLAVLLGQANEVTAKRDLVRLLRKTADPRAADALAAVVGDQDEDTREEAALGLAELGDARAVPPLIEQAKSPEDAPSTEAIDALRRLGKPGRRTGIARAVRQGARAQGGDHARARHDACDGSRAQADEGARGRRHRGRIQGARAAAVRKGVQPARVDLAAQQVQEDRLLAPERAVRDGVPQPARGDGRPRRTSAGPMPSWPRS